MSEQDETPAGGGGSVFDRVKRPAGGGSDGGSGGPEVLGTPPAPTDSTQLEEHTAWRHAGVAHRAPRAEDVDRRAERRAERLIAFWFTASVIGTLGFIVANFVGDKHKAYYTPVLGTALGLAVGGLGIGMILWAKRLMPHEQAVQERHSFKSTDEETAVFEEEVALGFHDMGLGRHKLLRRSLLGAGAVLGGLTVVPLLNLTNAKPGKKLDHTHWVKGARMVTGEGRFVKLGEIAIGGIETVFPAVPITNASGETEFEPLLDLHAKADSATILVRLEPGINKPRQGRDGWDVDGLVAYSKICSHAGCPVSLYEQQTHHLLCPCHQSVFDVPDGCRAIFGPASRSLPQLALGVDDEGYLIARDGDYTEPIGPAFWERS
ncbi:Rieske 2Fe-2S domain-containing protein [Frankia sp. CNm7]|uniref:Cytochrome bc1 complex Rieske iron-sulfur subunit n=1 Tax=Frankia nepalensis TaxID=1836974 RepID=A0A937RTP6_9ACTN|nr:Rieske 2Fe-2S domain-containing protein [Frankia nepalensis]MBL7500662.1 Rieske 2Fe-2S domain-containing protein [Frankia nepalensis]MBL7515120.1 Rieske 2Fe-2S domain-containing protein [Frankia nepalensis]MBL7522595.1 Rieske 2Fe-2S domain-containing protein [Frankia nepalensis]MBL7632603.1 Rieske 2Fe-2S domain-containing protein [Frankia nepalensis]